jgi:hypothetical protein
MLNVAAGLFALYMLARHVPRALRALRAPPDGRPPGGAIVPIVNVVLALAILAMAVTWLAAGLISTPRLGR